MNAARLQLMDADGIEASSLQAHRAACAGHRPWPLEQFGPLISSHRLRDCVALRL